jgi:hypothetical protein
LGADGTPYDSAAYVTALENCFVEIRGRGVLWSPADSDRARTWHAAGLPLGVVVRLIHARVRAWRFKHGSDAPVPHQLRWYEPVLLQQARHLQRLGPALSAPVADTACDAPLPLLVDAIPTLVERAAHPAVAHAYRKAFEVLDQRLQPADGDDGADADDAKLAPDRDDLGAALESCRKRIVKHVLGGLADAEFTAVEQAVALRMAPFVGRFSKRAQTVRELAVRELELAERFGLLLPTASGWIDPRCASA